MTTYGPYKGVVDQVRDGDTVYVKLTVREDIGFDVTLDANIYARVRVRGISADELSTQTGKEARDYARTLLKPGDAVTVLSYGWDKFGGRVDGTIDHMGQDFGAAMLAAGHAKPWDGKGPKP